MQIRQGDILLESVNKAVPAESVPTGKIILAEGEVTGHTHTLTAPAIYDWSEDGRRFVHVAGDAGTLCHEEHDPIPVKVVEPGTWEVIPQQETDLKNQWRKVRD